MTLSVTTPSVRPYVLCIVSIWIVLFEGQLWRLLVTSAVGLWAEERTDVGELKNLESRQFGGVYGRRVPRRLTRGRRVDSDVVTTAGIADGNLGVRGLSCVGLGFVK